MKEVTISPAVWSGTQYKQAAAPPSLDPRRLWVSVESKCPYFPLSRRPLLAESAEPWSRCEWGLTVSLFHSSECQWQNMPVKGDVLKQWRSALIRKLGHSSQILPDWGVWVCGEVFLSCCYEMCMMRVWPGIEAGAGVLLGLTLFSPASRIPPGIFASVGCSAVIRKDGPQTCGAWQEKMAAVYPL